MVIRTWECGRPPLKSQWPEFENSGADSHHCLILCSKNVLGVSASCQGGLVKAFASFLVVISVCGQVDR